MNIQSWANKKVRLMDWIDVAFVKLGVFSFALFIVKVWEPILSLEWYWYLIIYVILIARPFYRVYILGYK